MLIVTSCSHIKNSLEQVTQITKIYHLWKNKYSENTNEIPVNTPVGVL